MGIFSKLFKKKNNQENEMPVMAENINPNNIRITITKEGWLQIDYYNNEGRVGALNDSTRLVVTNTSEHLAQRYIPKCLVSHYNIGDCQVLRGYGVSSRENYKEILAEVDINLLQTDYKYCKAVMRDLLDSRRVEADWEQGLEENRQRQCGKYIGGIQFWKHGYSKFFDANVGVESHYSPDMIVKRQRYREEKEARRQREIESKRRRISELQSEIDDLYK